LNVATQRQIAANRRNARNSSGPRSAAGKKQASGNAYRHGLSLSINSSAVVVKEIEKLAHQIAGKSKREGVLQHARDAAEAELELTRVRKVRTEWIDEMLLHGALKAQHVPGIPDLVPSATSQEPERTGEAVRRALPKLVKLDRYETRAAARRHRAMLEIIRSRRPQA
jgi:hypothetical protein